MERSKMWILGAVATVAACAGSPEAGLEANASPAALQSEGDDRPGRGFGRGPEARLEFLRQELALTDVQVEQIRALFQSERQGDRGRPRGRGRGPGAFGGPGPFHEEIAALLTPEQRVKFEALPIEARLRHLKERLDLSDAQVGQVRAILQEFRPERPEGPPTEVDREARREARREVHARISEVLTAEQREEFEALRAERGRRGGGFGRGHGRHHGPGPDGFEGDCPCGGGGACDGDGPHGGPRAGELPAEEGRE